MKACVLAMAKHDMTMSFAYGNLNCRAMPVAIAGTTRRSRIKT